MKKDLLKLHHLRSQKDFPELKLEENEYVELAIRRSRLGIIFIWGAAALGYVLILVSIAIMLTSQAKASSVLSISGNARTFLNLIILVLCAAITLAAYVSTRVYNGNRLYVTNKRVIHHHCTSLFTKSVNIIELTEIEDVSFKQQNLIDSVFKLGYIRMSTVGDETTYTFRYVNTPHNELDTITHLVHVEKEKTKRRQRKLDEEDEQNDEEQNSDEEIA